MHLKYKKVLLLERKRHTARHVASARYTGGGGGGVPPIQSWWGGVPIQTWPGKDTPSSHGGGVPQVPPHHPDLARGVPHPVLVGSTLGTPHHPDLDGGTPHPDLARGYPWYLPPSRPGQGVPKVPSNQTWDGVPPIQTWDGVPPTIRPEMGYPPPSDLGWGTPPPPMVNRQTFPSINITFPRTTYAGGKNTQNDYFTII